MKFYHTVYNATMWQWFSNVLDKPSASRVNRRIKVRILRLERSAIWSGPELRSIGVFVAPMRSAGAPLDFG